MEDEIKAIKTNAKIVNSFVACLTKSATLMRIIAYSQDSRCRVGRAWKIKARIFQKLAPDDSIASIQLEEELNKLKLGSGKNAMYDLFEKTSALQLRFPLHCTQMRSSRQTSEKHYLLNIVGLVLRTKLRT